MILQEIAERTKIRIEEKKKQIPTEILKERAFNCDISADFPFKSALAREGISFICEAKKASPSKGIIAENFPYVQIAKEYEQAGASAISVLTEPYYFKGSDEYLAEIHNNVKIPLLRKDFTVDEYMLYEAKIIGASAVLLICSLLDDDTLYKYLDIAHSLGLSALVEAHDKTEVQRAADVGAKIIGVNNRDLKTFTVDITNAVRLREYAPDNAVYVAESGIKTADDIALLYINGVDAVLIGETFMRSDNKAEMLKTLQSKCNVH